MRPRFGTLTRVLAVVFLLAGLGAGQAALTAGDQMTPGHEYDRLILVVLAVGYLIVGVGLWGELVWAWWTGIAVTGLTVVLDAALLRDGGWIVWSVFLVLFAITAIQGRQMGSSASGQASHH